MFRIGAVREVSLTNVKDKGAVLAARARNVAWPVEGSEVVSHPWRGAGADDAAVSGTRVTLGPLEIKTFVVALA